MDDSGQHVGGNWQFCDTECDTINATATATANATVTSDKMATVTSDNATVTSDKLATDSLSSSTPPSVDAKGSTLGPGITISYIVSSLSDPVVVLSPEYRGYNK